MPIADRYLADLEASLARGGRRRDAPPAPVERRHDVGGGRAAAAARHGRVGAGAAAWRRRGSSPRRRPPERHRLRHGRDDHRRLPDRRRPGGEPAPAAAGRAPRAAALGRRRVDRRGRGIAGPGRRRRAPGGAGERGRAAGARVLRLGGTAPTVTDAHAVAGTLRGDALLGEAIRVDAGARRAALEPVAQALGLGLHEAAAGVLEVANAAMRRAIRLISVQRGHDLRGFALIAYGGAGPLHAGRLAQELGMPRRRRPRARGRVLGARLRRGRGGLRPRPDLPAAARRAGGGGARGPVRAAGGGGARAAPGRGPPGRGDRGAARASTSGTSGRTTSSRCRGPATSTALRGGFHALHRRLYAYATDDAVECVNLRVRAGVEGGARLPEWPATGTGQPFTEHEAYFPETGLHRPPGVPAGGSPARAPGGGSGPHRGSVGDDPRLPGPARAASIARGTCGWGDPTSCRGSDRDVHPVETGARKCRPVRV